MPSAPYDRHDDVLDEVARTKTTDDYKRNRVTVWRTHKHPNLIKLNEAIPKTIIGGMDVFRAPLQ